MSGSRFASRATVRIDLPGGAWVEVRERLSLSEAQTIAAASLVTDPETHLLDIDPVRFRLARILAYVTGWSRSEKLTYSALTSLDPSELHQIDAAIEQHEDALAAAENG